MSEQISYVAHEADMVRMERVNRRVWILCIILIAALIGTNAGWIWYEAQFEDVTVTAEQQADGNSNNYAIGGDYNGSTAESNN